MVKKAPARKKPVAKRKAALAAPPVTQPVEPVSVMLNLGCGHDVKEGFVNVDIRPIPNTLQVDLRKPWPWADDSISYIESKDLLPCLPMLDRLEFFNEAWRVLQVGAKMTINIPGRGSDRAIADPTFLWPEIPETFFYHASKEWRDAVKYDGYTMKANFHWAYGWVFDDEIAVRSPEAQRYAVKFYRNSITAMILTFTKLA